MREICTSGSTRGQQATIESPAVLLYWLILILCLLRGSLSSDCIDDR